MSILLLGLYPLLHLFGSYLFGDIVDIADTHLFFAVLAALETENIRYVFWVATQQHWKVYFTMTSVWHFYANHFNLIK